MKYTVTCGDRSYEVQSIFNPSLDVVWASQKSFFAPGSKVVIKDENGNCMEFVKE